MAKNPVGFEITNSTAGWNGADFDDVFIRKDCFLDGGLWTWGGAFGGRLANNSSINRSSPIQTVSGGTNWKCVSSGSVQAAIKSDGTLWTWGVNVYGNLGNNNRVSQSSPVQTVSGGTDWKSVSTSQHMMALKTDGSLWTWGFNSVDAIFGFYSGVLGTGNYINRSSPVQTISGGTNWKSISAGSDHSIAIKTDGTLWTWGYGLQSGVTGNNLRFIALSPVQTVSNVNTWKQASGGYSTTVAIKTDGTLWLWGRNSNGQLGTNSIVFRSSPVQTVSGGTNWKVADAGICTISAIKTDGTLWLWGFNNLGQLGTNDIINRSSPAQTVSSGTNWKTISVGCNSGAAIKTDGTLWVWGRNDTGHLGNNSVINASSPVQTISGGTNWKTMSAKYNVIAIREDCW